MSNYITIKCSVVPSNPNGSHFWFQDPSQDMGLASWSRFCSSRKANGPEMGSLYMASYVCFLKLLVHSISRKMSYVYIYIIN